MAFKPRSPGSSYKCNAKIDGEYHEDCHDNGDDDSEDEDDWRKEQSDPLQVLHDLAGRAELLRRHDAAAGGWGGRGDLPVLGPRAPPEYQAPRDGQCCCRGGE